MAEGMCGRGGHAWQACVKTLPFRGHAWQGSVCGWGHVWQGCGPLQWAIHILLECILVVQTFQLQLIIINIFVAYRPEKGQDIW